MTSFRIFVLVAIIWGFTIGVGFIAGFAIGNRTDENEDKADSMPSRPDFERIRERIESGEIDEEELERMRERFRPGQRQE